MTAELAACSVPSMPMTLSGMEKTADPIAPAVSLITPRGFVRNSPRALQTTFKWQFVQTRPFGMKHQLSI